MTGAPPEERNYYTLMKRNIWFMKLQGVQLHPQRERGDSLNPRPDNVSVRQRLIELSRRSIDRLHQMFTSQYLIRAAGHDVSVVVGGGGTLSFYKL